MLQLISGLLIKRKRAEIVTLVERHAHPSFLAPDDMARPLQLLGLNSPVREQHHLSRFGSKELSLRGNIQNATNAASHYRA